MEQFNQKPKEKYLVEDCYKIYAANFNFGDRFLIKEDNSFPVTDGINMAFISYKFDLNKNPLKLKINFQSRNGGSFWQNIEIEEAEITYGTRFYFICGCGKRCGVLYLRRDKLYTFGCRECLNLRYHLTTINKNSLAGSLFYRYFQHGKIKMKELQVGRVVYNGKMTKGARRVIEMIKKY